MGSFHSCPGALTRTFTDGPLDVLSGAALAVLALQPDEGETPERMGELWDDHFLYQ